MINAENTNINNLEIVANNEAKATTNAEDIDNELVNTDNINNAETEIDKSEDIVMSEDNDYNTAMSDKESPHAIPGDENVENSEPGENSTEEVPSPLIYDDFMCDQNCHTKTQYKQQDQTITPCTHAYDHITQHIDNLEDPTQQHTVYTKEMDAALFTTDTTTSCDYNITSMPNSNNPQETKTNITQPMGIHSQSKHVFT